MTEKYNVYFTCTVDVQDLATLYKYYKKRELGRRTQLTALTKVVYEAIASQLDAIMEDEPEGFYIANPADAYDLLDTILPNNSRTKEQKMRCRKKSLENEREASVCHILDAELADIEKEADTGPENIDERISALKRVYPGEIEDE